FFSPSQAPPKLLRLLKIRPENFSPNQLVSILKETTRQILAKVYLQPDPNLDELWPDLAQSEQLEINIAQDRLVENLFHAVRQLGIHASPGIKDLLREWDQIKDR